MSIRMDLPLLGIQAWGELDCGVNNITCMHSHLPAEGKGWVGGDNGGDIPMLHESVLVEGGEGIYRCYKKHVGRRWFFILQKASSFLILPWLLW